MLSKLLPAALAAAFATIALGASAQTPTQNCSATGQVRCEEYCRLAFDKNSDREKCMFWGDNSCRGRYGGKGLDECVSPPKKK